MALEKCRASSYFGAGHNVDSVGDSELDRRTTQKKLTKLSLISVSVSSRMRAAIAAAFAAYAAASFGSAVSVVSGGIISISSSWFGFNPGDNVVRNKSPWLDETFLASSASLQASSTRFPSGTAANYWSPYLLLAPSKLASG